MLKVFVGNNISRKAVNVSHDATLRSVFEDNQIDYGIGTNSLDGATLQPGDLDKTFAEMGVTGETCYLMNIAKAVNAAGIKVLAQTAVIGTEYTREQIEEIAKYRPKALSIFDPETKEPVYSVCLTSGKGMINKIGAEFGTGKTADGKACISMDIPEGTEDVKKFLENKVGVAILNLAKVEAQWDATLAEIAAEKEAVLGTIEVL